LNFTFTINRNGAVMVFIAILVVLGYYKATGYIEFIVFVATAIIVGFALSELAWHLPDEDMQKQPRSPRDYGNIGRTSAKIIVASALIIAGLFIVFLVLGIVAVIITLVLTSSASTLGAVVFTILIFFVCSIAGIGSILFGGRILLRMFKDEEAE